MSSKTINISLPENLVKEMDRAAMAEYASRSDYIRESIVRRLRNQIVVDAWGDEGIWESVADFTKIDPAGVPIDDVLASLEQLRKE